MSEGRLPRPLAQRLRARHGTRRQPARPVSAGLMALALGLAACAPAPTTAPSPTPTPTATPTVAASPPIPPATLPPGTSIVRVPEAGIALPVPSTWRPVTAAELADPAVAAELAATYPGAAELLAAVDELNGRAVPVFIAVDPAAAGSEGPLAANLSVLVAQPSVGGPLLDLVAGFICDALTDALAAPTSPAREGRRLPIGDTVRCTYDLPPVAGDRLVAEAWVIGAPSATVLVTLLGPASALGAMTAEEIVEAIQPVPGPAPGS